MGNIMAVIKFGYTWWGKSWLNALSNIDESNRLPRGARYARNGSVLELTIADNQIHASIQGSMARPYVVHVKLKRLSDKDTEIIANTIQNNPFYLAKLISHELPSKLNSDLANLGIDLFPSSWKDFNGYCSCPDHANPCKHLAAVVYMIANQIDKNPFIIFDLYGFDILASMKNKGILDDTPQIIKQFTDLLVDIVPKTDVAVKKLENSSPRSFQVDPRARADDNGSIAATEHESIRNTDEVSFAKLFAKGSKILDVLNDNPLFYLSSNMKTILDKYYLKLSKNVTTLDALLKTNKDDNTFDYELHKILITPELGVTFEFSRCGEPLVVNDVSQVIKLVLSIPFMALNQHEHNLRILHTVYSFTFSLLQNRFFVPELYVIKDREFILRYIPAQIDEVVNQVMAQIVKLFIQPVVLLTNQNNNVKLKRAKKQLKNEIELPAIEQIKWLVAIFINYFIRQSAQLVDMPIQQSYDEKIKRLFFLNEAVNFDQGMEQDVPNHIALWLDKFFLHQQRYTPVLRIEEQKADFRFDL